MQLQLPINLLHILSTLPISSQLHSTELIVLSIIMTSFYSFLDYMILGLPVHLGHPKYPSMHSVHFSPVCPFKQLQMPVTLLHTLSTLPITSQLQSTEVHKCFELVNADLHSYGIYKLFYLHN